MKKLHGQVCAALLTSSILLGGFPAAQVSGATTDIKGHWAQTQMEHFIEKGYISGDGTGNYLPNQVMSRAQFAAVINRVLGFTEESASITSYADVAENAWYRADLAKALSAGYMSGTSATTMSPDAPVTREQAAVMLIRLIKKDMTENASVLETFSDYGEISAYAVTAMAKLVANGYLYGTDGKLMPQKTLTRAEGVALLSRIMNDLKSIDPGIADAETLTEQTPKSTKSNTNSRGGGSNSGNSNGESGGSKKPSQNIAKTAQTKLIDLGRSKYVVIAFEDGFSKENTKLFIDGVDITTNVTNVDDDGTIVKWELTSLNPGRLVLESGSDKQEVKLTDNQNPEKPVVLAEVPESYNFMANGSVAVWDYHLTNYDAAGNVRVYPEKTTFDLDTKDESVPYYSPDAEVSENGTGEVLLMFNYNTSEEKQWFDSISDVDLVAYNENNNTLNNDLKYTLEQADHHGKTVGQIRIPLGQKNFFSNGRYNIRVTNSKQSWLFPIHVVNEKAPSLYLQGNGGMIQSGENVHFHVEDMVYGVTMPVYRVTLTAPDGKTRELEKITDWYLIGDLFVLYNDAEGHNNIPNNGTYTLKIYADGFKPMETTFKVGSGANNAIVYAGADAVTMATVGGSGSSGGEGGSSVMNAYLIFDSDLLANAQILTELEIEQENAADIAERWEQDMTSWLYVFDKSGKIFYDYSGKSGAFINQVNDAEKNGEYLTFAEFQKESNASITQNRPYAAKYVLEDNLLGETQMGGSYIGRPAPELTVVESVEGKELKLSCEDTAYLAAIAEDGKIYLNGDNRHPLQKDDYVVDPEAHSLIIDKSQLQIGENTVHISAAGYQEKEMIVNYGKTIEETTLEAKSGNVGEAVSISVTGENASGDIWKYLKTVKLTYPDGTARNVLPNGQESFYEQVGYRITGKKLILGKDLFDQEGTYQISVTAEHYGTKTVTFHVGREISAERKPVPVYTAVTCDYNTLWETTYMFMFAPSYNDDISEWINAVNKVTVNGTAYGSSIVENLYFTTYETDHQIKLHGDAPFTEGKNIVVISAEGYEDLTLIVGKDGMIGEEDKEDPDMSGENKSAPAAGSMTFVDTSFVDDYYRLTFDLSEKDVSAYLDAISSIQVDGQACKKVTALWNEANAYKFSYDEVQGGANKFIDFTADCFLEENQIYTIEIIADGYETQTLKIKNGNLYDGTTSESPEENRTAPW